MKHVHPHHRRNSKILYTIYYIGFIFTLAQALPVYINSTFLSQFLSESVVGVVYTIASIITIAAFTAASFLVRRYGNYRMAISLLVMQMVALAGLAFSGNVYWILFYFVSSIVLMNLIWFTVDIFLEANSDDHHTGNIRGIFLTAINIGWILSPMLAATLITSNDYWKIYAAALLLLLPLWMMITRNFRKFKDPVYPRAELRATLARVLKNRDLSKLFGANIILNMFYAWMVIYTPIYLHQHIGFDWDSLGLIFTIMLLPFAIFELPAGRLADSKWGEKEFMSIGFLIMGLSTIGLSFINGANLWLWAGILFVTRVGASIAEIMIETYFFKKIDTKDANILSSFRITRPIAYIIAPLITVIGLYFVDYKYLFVILGVITLFALYFTLRIKDTN